MKWIRINAESHITGMESVYVLRSLHLVVDLGEIEKKLLVLGLDLGAKGLGFFAEKSVVAYLGWHGCKSLFSK